MNYFIDYITTYANVNKKGKELQMYVQQFNHHLIAHEVSLDALKCDIEHQIDVLNEKYPRSRYIHLVPFSDAKGGQWTICVKDNPDDVVCIISYQKVLGYYALADRVDDLVKIK
ncbi:hypothetical protein EV202_1278 [Bacteroides heparinolyticus]|uniref:Uncharacterized protein n=1 Tax=Prevotella heparinolytica TaxID=28113 RepID=A0A4R2LHC5_9BACE|nr:hypothetical protein [Bacteroides heparinolyticus]TCO88125.1 hypothetical protein EV202_1278 [Bacteroides heparinolyticus]